MSNYMNRRSRTRREREYRRNARVMVAAIVANMALLVWFSVLFVQTLEATAW